MNSPLSRLNRQRSAVEASRQALLQRQQRIADTRSHLKSTCACLCAQPSTLAVAFAVGGVIGITSTRVDHTPSTKGSDDEASHLATTSVWTTFGALAIHLATRYAGSHAASVFFQRLRGNSSAE